MRIRQFIKHSTAGRLISLIVSYIFSGLVGTLAWELLTGNREDELFYVFLVILFLIPIFLMGKSLLTPSPSRIVVDVGTHITRRRYIVSGLSWLNYPPDSEKEKDSETLSNLHLIINLIRKHDPVLHTIYLIDSKASGVQRSIEALKGWFDDNVTPKDDGQFHIEYITVQDGYDMQEVYQVVKNKLNTLNLPPQETIFDVTAGTAAISTGMTMAALELGYSISYQATDHTDENKLGNKTNWQFFENKIKRIYEIYPPAESFQE